MIDSVYLDWAIGLAVVFFLGGLVVSGFNEGLSWITRVRAKFLWAYLYDLFDPSAKRALPDKWRGVIQLWGTTVFGRRTKKGTARDRDKRPLRGSPPGDAPELRAQRWLHSLAERLEPILATQIGGTRTSIKDIPPASLAQALVEVFADVGRTQMEEHVTSLVKPDATDDETVEAAAALRRQLSLKTDLATAVADLRSDRSQANADALADLLDPGPSNLAMREAWRDVATNWDAEDNVDRIDAIVTAITRAHPTSERARIESALDGLDQASPITKTLRRLWAGTEGKTDAFRKDIERYLDADMQRLSGLYRRSIRVVMFVLALLVSVVAGIDAVELGTSTWRDPAARAALVQRADALADATSSDTKTTNSDANPTSPDTNETGTVLQTIRERCGADKDVDSTETEPFNTKSEADQKLADVRSCVSDSIDELTGANPLGNAMWSDYGGWKHEWASRPAWHALGTLLAAIALMLGAPFWFDVIKRLTGVRKPTTRDA